MRRRLVYIVQPVIPHYRLPFFDALAGLVHIDIEVHASQQIAGAPASLRDLPDWAHTSHRCLRFLGGRLLWQQGLDLPKGFGRGDVLVVNGNPRFLSNLPLIARARFRGAGVVWWGHGWSPTSRPWRAAIRYRLMAVADVILLYTDAEVARLSHELPPKRKALALNNTLDRRPIERAMAEWTPDRLAKFQRDRGLHDHTTLLFCGRLRVNPSTELEVAMKALSLLLEREGQDKYLLVVIGDGDDTERLRALADELGLEGNIRWQDSIFDESELAPWFMSALCLVFPGPIGLSLIHALSYGLPVVTHSSLKLHNPEIAALRHGSNGLLFEPRSAEDLAQQISILASDQLLRQKMSESALQVVRTEFSFDGMVRRFEEAIERAAAIADRR